MSELVLVDSVGVAHAITSRIDVRQDSLALCGHKGQVIVGRGEVTCSRCLARRAPARPRVEPPRFFTPAVAQWTTAKRQRFGWRPRPHAGANR